MANAKKKNDQGRKCGEGSRYQLPSGSWRIQIVIDGELHRETFPTAEAADACLAELRSLKQDNYDIARGLQTVTAFFTDWIDLRRQSTRSARTTNADTRIAEGYILPHIGDRRRAVAKSF